MAQVFTPGDRRVEVEVETLSDTQVEVNAKALDYQMADRQAEIRVEKLGETSQRRK